MPTWKQYETFSVLHRFQATIIRAVPHLLKARKVPVCESESITTSHSIDYYSA